MTAPQTTETPGFGFGHRPVSLSVGTRVWLTEKMQAHLKSAKDNIDREYALRILEALENVR